MHAPSVLGTVAACANAIQRSRSSADCWGTARMIAKRQICENSAHGRFQACATVWWPRAMEAHRIAAPIAIRYDRPGRDKTKGSAAVP